MSKKRKALKYAKQTARAQQAMSARQAAATGAQLRAAAAQTTYWQQQQAWANAMARQQWQAQQAEAYRRVGCGPAAGLFPLPVPQPAGIGVLRQLWVEGDRHRHAAAGPSGFAIAASRPEGVGEQGGHGARSQEVSICGSGCLSRCSPT